MLHKNATPTKKRYTVVFGSSFDDNIEGRKTVRVAGKNHRNGTTDANCTAL